MPPLTWRIDRLLPERGMLVLGGAPKRGKSRLGLDLARRLVQGRDALGMLGVNICKRVLVYNVEGGHEGVRARNEMFDCMTSDERDRLVIEDRPIMFTRPNGTIIESAMGEALANWLGFDVVVLDPLVHFRGCDENNNQHSAALMRAIRDASERAHVSTIVVHHARKPGAEDRALDGNDLRGASAIFAAADNVLMLGRGAGGFLTCGFDLRYVPVADGLDGLVLQGDRASGLMYTRNSSPAPDEFVRDWGFEHARYASAFGRKGAKP